MNYTSVNGYVQVIERTNLKQVCLIDLYTHGAIDEETFTDIKDNYSKDKRKDDFDH